MQYQYMYTSRVDHVLTHVMLKTNNYQLSFIYSYIYSDIYITICPASISRVLFDYSILGEYLCKYKGVPSSLMAGIFLGKG